MGAWNASKHSLTTIWKKDTMFILVNQTLIMIGKAMMETVAPHRKRERGRDGESLL